MAERATTKSNRSAAVTPAESVLGEEANSYKDILLGKIQLMVQQYKNYQQHKMHFRPEAELTSCGLLTLAGCL